jgi:hypothetical protein
VRLLELKTRDGDSAQITPVQLARGLQILLDPGLRQDYFGLLENPEYSTALPPWTIGSLLATGQKKGDLFVVSELLRFVRFRYRSISAAYRAICQKGR